MIKNLFLCLVLSLVTALSSAAQDTPRFLVERIAVEGVKRETARRIVLSESLLREGQSYTEQELREAVYRVRRLPFVVDADMSLRKGSERGAYELVLQVETARPLAFAVGVNGFGQDPDDDPFRRGGVEWYTTATLGARKFVGARGLLFGSVDGAEATDASGYGQGLQIGYSQYGLFRPGGFATVSLYSRVGEESEADDLQAVLQTGIPIVGNHAIRSLVTWSQIELELPLFPEGHLTQRAESWRGQLAWLYDSTDDPLVPTEGLYAGSWVTYDKVRQETRGFGEGFEQDNEQWDLGVEGRRYWSLTPRQAAGFGGGYVHTESGSGSPGFRQDSLRAQAIYAVNLWGFEKSRRLGDLRFETGLGYETFRQSSPLDEDASALSLQSSLLFRNAWGLARLSFLYTDRIGVDQ